MHYLCLSSTHASGYIHAYVSVCHCVCTCVHAWVCSHVSIASSIHSPFLFPSLLSSLPPFLYGTFLCVRYQTCQSVCALPREATAHHLLANSSLKTLYIAHGLVSYMQVSTLTVVLIAFCMHGCNTAASVSGLAICIACNGHKVVGEGDGYCG